MFNHNDDDDDNDYVDDDDESLAAVCYDGCCHLTAGQQLLLPVSVCLFVCLKHKAGLLM